MNALIIPKFIALTSLLIKMSTSDRFVNADMKREINQAEQSFWFFRTLRRFKWDSCSFSAFYLYYCDTCLFVGWYFLVWGTKWLKNRKKKQFSWLYFPVCVHPLETIALLFALFRNVLTMWSGGPWQTCCRSCDVQEILLNVSLWSQTQLHCLCQSLRMYLESLFLHHNLQRSDRITEKKISL